MFGPDTDAVGPSHHPRGQVGRPDAIADAQARCSHPPWSSQVAADPRRPRPACSRLRARPVARGINIARSSPRLAESGRPRRASRGSPARPSTAQSPSHPLVAGEPGAVASRSRRSTSTAAIRWPPWSRPSYPAARTPVANQDAAGLARLMRRGQRPTCRIRAAARQT